MTSTSRPPGPASSTSTLIGAPQLSFLLYTWMAIAALALLTASVLSFFASAAAKRRAAFLLGAIHMVVPFLFGRLVFLRTTPAGILAAGLPTLTSPDAEVNAEREVWKAKRFVVLC